MKIVKSCEKCLYEKQADIALRIPNERKRQEYLDSVQNILATRSENDSSPYIVSLFRELQVKYDIPLSIFPKEKYNSMLLALESDIEKDINSSMDPLRTAMLYSRVGNYIDFGAMNNVDDDVLLKLISEVHNSSLDEKTYEKFLSECEKASEFLLICDNCGEIVLDKLLVRQIKRKYPKLNVKIMVRGLDVLNDATLADAHQSGISLEGDVITNGSAIAGTVYERLSEEARMAFDNADIIVSKGQGNYESISGTEKKAFYLFLCKCDLFTSRFNVPKLTGMFVYI